MEDKLAGKELLASIRTANRLVYEYQKRILEFMSYFKMKFRLEDNQIAAIKRDSNAFYKTKAYSDDYSDANLKVWTNMWAWDFIYTNLMEYYFGWTKRNKMSFCLSFVQMTDSGYYESTDSKRSWTSLRRYAEVEKSHSYGFFVFECKKNSIRNFDSIWDVNKDIMESWVDSIDDLVVYQENDKSKYLVFRFNMEDIMNQESADVVLSRFSNIVKQKTDIDMVLQCE